MIPYIGGKNLISSFIHPYIPRNIETYVEPMSGMYWVFLKMNLSEFTNLKTVIYNDVNPLNYNLFKCIQNAEELLRVVDSIDCQKKNISDTPTIYKEQFDAFQKEVFNPDIVINSPDYEIAAKYAYVLASVFSGSKPDKSQFIDLKGKYRSKYLAFRDKLSKPQWIEHFLKITAVENLDFSDVIKKYDSEDTYFYCDPPYFSTENYYSNHDFGRDDHERFANSIKSSVGKFGVSYYDFPQLHEWFPEDKYKWVKRNFSKAAGATKGKKQNIGEEILILNY